MNHETMFTKGDWVIRGREIGTVDRSDTQSYGMLNVIARVEMYDHGEEAGKANAHLIIAAPELYAELEFIRSYIQENRAIEFKNRINNLLSKARGEK